MIYTTYTTMNIHIYIYICDPDLRTTRFNCVSLILHLYLTTSCHMVQPFLEHTARGLALGVHAWAHGGYYCADTGVSAHPSGWSQKDGQFEQISTELLSRAQMVPGSLAASLVGSMACVSETGTSHLPNQGNDVASCSTTGIAFPSGEWSTNDSAIA